VWSNSHYENRLFESPPLAGFQITDFSVSSAFGTGNTKIDFAEMSGGAKRRHSFIGY
jgi:hypothetical protein